jgi:Spy/CpxP family protein refolding chaperone
MQKKQIAALILVPTAILATAATWRMSQGPSAKQDVESLHKQLSAQGRMGGPGGPGRPGGMPGNFDPRRMQAQMLDRMGKALNLTDVQKQQLGQLHEAQMPRMQEIMRDNSLTGEQKRSRMDEARKDQEARIKTILTPEQQTRYDEMQQKARERGQQMRAAMGNAPMGGPPPDGMMGGPPPDGGMGGPPPDGGMGGPPPGGPPPDGDMGGSPPDNAPGNGKGQGGN